MDTARLDAEREAMRVFMDLIELEPAHREIHLSELTTAPEIKDQVRRLLLSAEQGAGSTSLRSFANSLDQTGIQHLPITLGKFRLVEYLGSGSMGRVYRGQDLTSGTDVAVKILRSDALVDERQGKRFELEFSVARTLDHPSIIRVIQAGTANGLRFIAMELVFGQTLLSRIAAWQTAPHGGDADEGIAEASRIREAIIIVRDIAAALGHAHAAGVLHRDVKPSNVIIDQDGHAKLTDFGIAKLIHAETQVTKTGEGLGTAAYMSPEQASLGQEPLDGRSDLFGLGVVLYECLTRSRPFDDQNPQLVLERIRTEEPARPSELNPDVPRPLELICLKLLEKQPAHRYQSASDLIADFDSWLDGQPVTARAPSLIRRLRAQACRRPRVVAASVSLLAATFLIPAILQPTSRRANVVLTMSDAGPATAWAQKFATDTGQYGEPIRLGEGGRIRAALAAGLYRFTVVRQNRFMEIERLLPEESMHAIEVAIDKALSVPERMVEISLDQHGSGTATTWAPQRVWIDQTEVTNAEYSRFLDATDWPPPPHWELAPRGSGPWRSLPVAGVSHRDAVAFAEWSGKRLPTKAEWRAAASTVPELAGEGIQLLAGKSFESFTVFNRVHGTEDEVSTMLASLRPADDPGSHNDRSAEGVLNLIGNVAEWTGSPGGEGRWIVAGSAWEAIQPPTSLSSVLAEDEDQVIGRGFRCARSALPLGRTRADLGGN
ncbi:MAG: bifunctional serine/threonine-protein kinase/formylglycine-generating enzyme family protein [Planctomycetota bacterium]